MKRPISLTLITTGDFLEQMSAIDALIDSAKRWENIEKNKDDSVPLLEKGQKYVGKTLRLILPLEIEGVENEYTFVYEIKGVEQKEVERSEEKK